MMVAAKAVQTVLVVEDECLVAWHVQTVLNELGFDDVHLAHDLAGAQQFLETVRPVFAILDVNLGKSLIFPLAAELYAQNVPFLFSTARAASEMPAEWSRHPLAPKPLKRDALAGAIRALGIALPAGQGWNG